MTLSTEASSIEAYVNKTERNAFRLGKRRRWIEFYEEGLKSAKQNV